MPSKYTTIKFFWFFWIKLNPAKAGFNFYAIGFTSKWECIYNSNYQKFEAECYHQLHLPMPLVFVLAFVKAQVFYLINEVLL